MADPHVAARAALRRSLIAYSAFLALDVVALSYIIVSGPGGAGYVSLAIVGVIGLLLTLQVWMHIRDIAAPPAETLGVIQKRWSRADLIIVWHSYYIAVERRVFRLRPEDHVLLEVGMRVNVVHFPRTLHVVSISEVRRDPSQPPSAAT